MTKEQLKTQAKVLLDERLSDEELDGVAGGTYAENEDILVAMGNVDPEGLMDLLKRWDQDPRVLGTHLKNLVDTNFQRSGINVEFIPGDYRNSPNQYKIDGKPVSHKTFIGFLNSSGGGDDF